ncbi:MAG: hypothetical protein PWP23_2742 [Candidatus Sumerlaeota bacterium]|nr:hypothetical protein [Candidatus Sumerlaeota bacterium]
MLGLLALDDRVQAITTVLGTAHLMAVSKLLSGGVRGVGRVQ